VEKQKGKTDEDKDMVGVPFQIQSGKHFGPRIVHNKKH